MAPRYNPDDYDPSNRPDFSLPPEGDYPFVVVGAEDRTSQAGNAMLNMKMAFDVGREKDLTVYNNLVFTAKAMGFVHDFCACVGHDFSAGSITPQDVQGSSGIAHLKVGKANSNGKTFMEVAYFKTREGYTEQPAQSRRTPPRTAPTDDYYADAPPPSDTDAAAACDTNGPLEYDPNNPDDLPF